MRRFIIIRTQIRDDVRDADYDDDDGRHINRHTPQTRDAATRDVYNEAERTHTQHNINGNVGGSADCVWVCVCERAVWLPADFLQTGGRPLCRRSVGV